ncbi:unnamed protein product [Caenorhabditis auriculariae]|uniref:non-specific serine/threonine protein kinase n=1 Tax=Caenorhabditis auriculariae TaxID=2777116 RepID=A0A8S1HXQ2_9PELO|nr:unnamed protein product [Caenorhabditis auriculariae]
MLRKYGKELKDAEGYKKAKEDAKQEKKNWLKYKIEQAVTIFQPETKYISKTAKLDDKHPLANSRNKVKDKDGHDMKITFGKLHENILSIYPNRQFILIPELIEMEKERNTVGDSYVRRHKIGHAVEHKKERTKKRNTSFFSLSRNPDGESPDTNKRPEQSESEAQISIRHTESTTKASVENEINTTDKTATIFAKSWYTKALQIKTRNKKDTKNVAYWTEIDKENTTMIDDDEFAVTAETIEDTLTGASGVNRPEEFRPPKFDEAFGSLSKMVEEAKKSSSRAHVYRNTVWGTIDFTKSTTAKKEEAKSKEKTGQASVTWGTRIEVSVYKGKRMKRDKHQLSVRSAKMGDLIQLDCGKKVKQWRIDKKLGEGAFGAVYKCSNEKGDFYALKVEGKDEKIQLLKMEVYVLAELMKSGGRHFCKINDKGTYENFNYVVMTFVGLSLADLRLMSPGKKFSMGTAISVGIQCLEALEDLHNIGYLHRDVKPGNYTIGRPEVDELRKVYVLDFGMARKFVHEDGTIKKPRTVAGFRGTVKYAPVSCHSNRELCRQDDCETWLYMLVELTKGSLPWRNLTDIAQIGNEKRMCRTNEIQQKKFFGGCPREFIDVMRAIDGGKFFDEPDYNRIYYLLRQAMKNTGAVEFPYDWEDRLKKQHKEDQEKKKSGAIIPMAPDDAPSPPKEKEDKKDEKKDEKKEEKHDGLVQEHKGEKKD